MRVCVKKWGNSAAVRIPLEIMTTAHMRIDQVMDIHEEAGRIILEPVREPSNLSTLLSSINDQNQHNEVDFGDLVGHEAL